MGAGVVLWHVTTVTQPAAMKVIDELKETVSLQQAMLTTRCGHATAGDLLQDGRIPIPKPSYTGDPIQ